MEIQVDEYMWKLSHNFPHISSSGHSPRSHSSDQDLTRSYKYKLFSADIRESINQPPNPRCAVTLGTSISGIWLPCLNM